MGEIIKAGQRFSRRPIDDDEARTELANEKFKLELIGLKSNVSGEEATEVGVRRADDVRQPRRQVRRAGVDRPVPRPAPADHPAHPGVQADAQRGRVLARQREEPAVAAHLRHRVGLARRSEGLPDPARGSRQARPPQARRRTRPVQLPRRARFGPGGVPPEGRHPAQGARGLRRGSATSTRASTSSRPRTSARTACSTPPDTCRTTPTRCSRRWSSRSRSTGSRR